MCENMFQCMPSLDRWNNSKHPCTWNTIPYHQPSASWLTTGIRCFCSNAAIWFLTCCCALCRHLCLSNGHVPDVLWFPQMQLCCHLLSPWIYVLSFSYYTAIKCINYHAEPTRWHETLRGFSAMHSLSSEWISLEWTSRIWKKCHLS